MTTTKRLIAIILAVTTLLSATATVTFADTGDYDIDTTAADTEIAEVIGDVPEDDDEAVDYMIDKAPVLTKIILWRIVFPLWAKVNRDLSSDGVVSETFDKEGLHDICEKTYGTRPENTDEAMQMALGTYSELGSFYGTVDGFCKKFTGGYSFGELYDEFYRVRIMGAQ